MVVYMLWEHEARVRFSALRHASESGLSDSGSLRPWGGCGGGSIPPSPTELAAN